MKTTPVNLPYFDKIIEKINREEAVTLQSFDRYVHYGYWEDPAQADGSVADWAQAAEKLNWRIFDAANITKGNLRVLDVGCGFGGTIASLNERYEGMDLVGLNIDPRQIEIAQKRVAARPGNQIQFVEGNACELPFEDASFDIVLAVECIFHFPSRQQFFQEARRVLRPGGRLALSDFVPTKETKPFLLASYSIFESFIYQLFGRWDMKFTVGDYYQMAGAINLAPVYEEDITANILPSFEVIYKYIFNEMEPYLAVQLVTKIFAASLRAKLLRKVILGFAAC